jgi:hypothetical protein
MNTPDRDGRRCDDRDMSKVTSVGPSERPELEPDVTALGVYGVGDFAPSKDLDIRTDKFESVSIR